MEESTVTDMDRLNAAFKELRREGIFCRKFHISNEELREMPLKGNFVITNRIRIRAACHSGRNIIPGKKLYLLWRGDGVWFKEVFEKHGFTVDWGGRSSETLGLTRP